MVAAFEHDVLERGHVVRPEGERPAHAHLDARPAIVVMARGHHRHALDLKCELREIGRRRQRQPDIVHLGAARQHASNERGI